MQSSPQPVARRKQLPRGRNWKATDSIPVLHAELQRNSLAAAAQHHAEEEDRSPATPSATASSSSLAVVPPTTSARSTLLAPPSEPSGAALRPSWADLEPIVEVDHEGALEQQAGLQQIRAVKSEPPELPRLPQQPLPPRLWYEAPGPRETPTNLSLAWLANDRISIADRLAMDSMKQGKASARKASLASQSWSVTSPQRALVSEEGKSLAAIEAAGSGWRSAPLSRRRLVQGGLNGAATQHQNRPYTAAVEAAAEAKAMLGQGGGRKTVSAGGARLPATFRRGGGCRL